MIEHLKDFPANVLAFVCKGRVTKQDYEAVLVPVVVDALKKHDKVRLYYETAGSGWPSSPTWSGSSTRSISSAF
jgi:hypothetical protein